MEFSTVVRRRRMVRNFDPDRPVPAELVDRLLEHAIRAPSAGFSQGWAFLVLTEPADRERFWTATSPATDRSDPASTGASTMRSVPELNASGGQVIGSTARPMRLPGLPGRSAV